MTDASELPWSTERLNDLAQFLLNSLAEQGVDLNDPAASATATAIAQWVCVRASALSALDVVEAIRNVGLLDETVSLGPINAALEGPL